MNTNKFYSLLLLTTIIFLLTGCFDYCVTGNQNIQKKDNHELIYQSDSINVLPISEEHENQCNSSSVADGGCTAQDKSCLLQCYSKHQFNKADGSIYNISSFNKWYSSNIVVNNGTYLNIEVEGSAVVCPPNPPILTNMVDSNNNSFTTLQDYVNNVMKSEDFYQVSTISGLTNNSNNIKNLGNGSTQSKGRSIKLNYGEILVIDLQRHNIKVRNNRILSENNGFIAVSAVGGTKNIYLKTSNDRLQYKGFYEVNVNQRPALQGDLSKENIKRFILSYDDLMSTNTNKGPAEIVFRSSNLKHGYNISTRTIGCIDSIGKYLIFRFKDKNNRYSKEYRYQDWSVVNGSNNSLIGGWKPSREANFSSGILEVKIDYPGQDNSQLSSLLGDYGKLKVNINTKEIKVIQKITSTQSTISDLFSDIMNPILDILWGPQLDYSGKRGLPTYYKERTDGQCIDKNGKQYSCKVCTGPSGSDHGELFVFYKDKSGECIRGSLGGAGVSVIPKIFAGITQDTNFYNLVMSVLIFYIVVYGIFFTLGIGETQTAYGFITHVIKVLIILALFNPYSWEFFRNYFFIIFIDGMGELLNFFIAPISYSLIGINSSDIETMNNFSFLDPIFSVFFEGDTWIRLLGLLFIGWDSGGLIFLGLILIIMILIGIVLFLLLFTKALIAYATAMIVVGFLVMLAPIFFIFSLFGWSKNIFKHWVDYIVGYSLQPVILFLCLSICAVVTMSAFYNIFLYDTCWQCVVRFEIEHIASFCILKFFLTQIPSDANRFIDLFFSIVVFVVLAELSGKISNWALKMALAISSVINDATSGVTQNAWSAIPYSATIESTMKNMPRSFATGVARTGIQTGKIAGYRAIGMSAKAVSKVAGSDNKVGMTASNLSTKMNISAKKVSSSKDNNFIQNKILSGFNATTKFAGDSLSKVVAAPVTVTRDAINSESANDFVKKQSEDAGNFITGGLFKKDDTGRTQIGRYFKNNVSDKFKVDGGIKNAIKHRKAEFAARAYHSLNPLKSSSFSQRK